MSRIRCGSSRAGLARALGADVRIDEESGGRFGIAFTCKQPFEGLPSPQLSEPPKSRAAVVWPASCRRRCVLGPAYSFVSTHLFLLIHRG